MKLIVGLGNPGNKYKKTRHNIGFMILDNYALNEKLSFKQNQKSEILIGDKFILLKPLTYMNVSGTEVKRIADYYKIVPENILVIHDDKDMIFGDFKLKIDSGAGGHNGIKSLINELKTQKFSRLKIGINNNSNMDTADFVLSNFSNDELSYFNSNVQIFNNIINDFLSNDIDVLMNKYNGDNNAI